MSNPFRRAEPPSSSHPTPTPNPTPLSLSLSPTQYRNSRSFASSTTQCSPSTRFMPVIALHCIIVHLCVLISSSLSPYIAIHWRSQRVKIKKIKKIKIKTYSPNLVNAHPADDLALIRKHQQRSPEEPFLLEEPVELGRAVAQPEPVGRVDNPDQGVGLFKVIAPVAAQRLLPANVPFCL